MQVLTSDWLTEQLQLSRQADKRTSGRQVETAAAAGEEGLREVGEAEMRRQLEARRARLRDLQDRRADAVDVADADVGLEYPVHRQVLAEGAGPEVGLADERTSGRADRGARDCPRAPFRVTMTRSRSRTLP